MDRREYVQNDEEVLRMAAETALSRVWTALPAIVDSFNPTNMTVEVLPTILGQAQTRKQILVDLPIPKLVDCPVLWMGGGGATFTFPIKKGDECLVLFASRCIDAWWYYGGVQKQSEFRMHSLSDGFALVGLRSLPRAKNFIGFDSSNACLQSDDGQTFVKLNPTTHAVSVTANGGINMSATGGITLNGVTIDQNGNVNTSATITATTDVLGGGKSLKTHIHVDPQGGNTSPPV